jgi:16S rRNA (uracil1498-N3)-methyltransferase
MPAHRFFVEGEHGAGDRVAIEGSDAHKLRHVLRAVDGSAIELIDSSGSVLDARLAFDGERIFAEIGGVRERPPEPPVPSIDLAQALAKGTKLDLVVEKATELGAARVIPFISERSVARDAGDGRLDRWRRIARTAAMQCGRRDIPQVDAPVTFDALIASFGRYDAVLFPWELADPRPLIESLRAQLDGATSVLAVIGPEGGFSHAEAHAAREAGARWLWLGPRILRTETAGLALLSVLGALHI